MSVFAWMAVMFTLVFLVGRTVGDYGRVLDSWVGQSEQKLVEVWGKPTRIGKTRDEDEKEVYIYSKASRSLRGSSGHCVSRFVIDDNRIIVESSYSGSNCLRLHADKDLFR